MPFVLVGRCIIVIVVVACVFKQARSPCDGEAEQKRD